jgi:hypothetical protein
MLLFADFAILPHHNPNDLRLENNKVTPSISLRLDNS